MKAATLILAGGGTGGHVFPMVAVADALREICPALRLIFVGTSRGIETRVVPERGYQLELIEALPMRGGGAVGTARGVARAVRNLSDARGLLKKYEPKAVFSLGGYAAGAISLAARLAGIPVALMEPNSVIGLSNRLIAPFVQRAYIAFDDTARHFSTKVVLRSGVAIRRGFDHAPYEPEADHLRLLVVGGSQGAQALNETVPRAVSQLGYRVSVLHQAGRGNAEAVRERYAKHCALVPVEVKEFIDDVPRTLGSADLVIARAGASTVSEICAVGRPSLLVPYPYASGDHQLKNAQSLERAGAALSVASEEATPERLALMIDRLATERERLVRMAEAAARWGRPHAAEIVARDLLMLAGLTEREAAAAPAKPARDNGVLQRAGAH
jgi:UDP-N-acetylglucosamine--N-acetylmuramyl-(pentapeptide) pyrophosphoryl-undecaprenol N-acetylglucosamine transferase